MPPQKTYVGLSSQLFYSRIPTKSKEKTGHIYREADLKVPYMPKVDQLTSPVSLQQLEVDSKEIKVDTNFCSTDI